MNTATTQATTTTETFTGCVNHFGTALAEGWGILPERVERVRASRATPQRCWCGRAGTHTQRITYRVA